MHLRLQSMQKKPDNSHKTLNSLIGKWLKQVGSNKKTFQCMRPPLSTRSVQHTLAKHVLLNPPYMVAGPNHKLVSMVRSSEKSNCTYDISQYQPAGHGNHLSHTHHHAIACTTQVPTKLGTALSLHTTQTNTQTPMQPRHFGNRHCSHRFWLHMQHLSIKERLVHSKCKTCELHKTSQELYTYTHIYRQLEPTILKHTAITILLHSASTEAQPVSSQLIHMQ